MKRLVFLALTLVPLLLASPAYARSAKINRDTSGPFTGTTVFASAASCGFFEQRFDASYAAKGKSGSFHLDGCVGLSNGPLGSFSYSGTFVLMAPNGATLVGGVSGEVGNGSGCAEGVPASLGFTLEPTSGTKQLTHVSGSIDLTGTWCSPAEPNVVGPIFGSLSAQLA
jgi:hypothetical protein